jgi:hypothetical protein
MVTCRRRYEILPAGCDWSLPECAPLENLAHDNVLYHSQDSAVRNLRLSGVPLLAFTRRKSVPELGIIRRLFEGEFMGVDESFRLCARLVELARAVDTNPASIGVLSTGEVCAVALLLGRLDLLDGGNYPLNALDRLGPRMEKAVRNLHASGWRR